MLGIEIVLQPNRPVLQFNAVLPPEHAESPAPLKSVVERLVLDAVVEYEAEVVAKEILARVPKMLVLYKLVEVALPRLETFEDKF